MTEGKITSLEVQKRNKERVNVYIDGEFAFGLNLLDAASLRKGQILTPTDITELQARDAVVRAVDSAANYLSYRPRTRLEVRRNLKKKGIDPDVIDAAMLRLDELGYLDDERFARLWVEDRNTFKPRGPHALRAELRQKGVSDAIIQQVVADVDVEDAAYRAAHKKLRRYRGETPFDFKRKLGAFLGRRGFGYEEINDTLTRIIQELEQTDPDYFAEEDV